MIAETEIMFSLNFVVALVLMTAIVTALDLSSLDINPVSLNLVDLEEIVNTMNNQQLIDSFREMVNGLTSDKDIFDGEGFRLQDLAFFSTFSLSKEKETSSEKSSVEVNSMGQTTTTQANSVGVTLPSIPSKTGLSPTCNNLACDTVYRALTCQGMSVKLSHQCARYIVGGLYLCSNYPQNLYNAPSICASEIKDFFLTLLGAFFTGGKEAAIKLLSAFLENPNFESATCGRKCYNYYAQAANTMYLQCADELQTMNKTYPFLSGIQQFNQFRMQGCNTNGTHNIESETTDTSSPHNCYKSFVRMQSDSKNGSPKVDTFNFKCYNYLPDFGPFADPFVMDGIYKKFNSYLGGCCFSSALQMSQQNQLNASNLVVWPPCLLTYFQSRGVKLQQLCSEQSIATQTTISLKMAVSGVPYPYPLLNTTFSPFAKSSVVNLMGAITTVLVKVNPAFQKQPYNFNPNYPFQVMITNGTVNPSGTQATYGLLFTVQNLNTIQAQTLTTTLLSTQFAGALATQVFHTSSPTGVTVTLADPSNAYILNQALGVLPPKTNNAYSSGMSRLFVGASLVTVSLLSMSMFV